MAWFRSALKRLASSGDSVASPELTQPMPDAAQWKERGNAALAVGRLPEAVRCYQQGVLADSVDPTLRLNLGYALLEGGDSPNAANQLTQALALLRPGDEYAHEIHFLLGRARKGLGQINPALASFEAAVAAKPDFADAMEEALRTLHEAGLHAKAIIWAKRLAQAKPSSFTQLLLAHELSLCGRDVEAAEILALICTREPGNGDAASLNGAVLFRQRRFEEALSMADRVLALGPPAADALADAGAALHKLGRLKEALARLDHALQLEPQHRHARSNRITVLLDLLRVREAIEAARDGLRLNPDDGDLHWSLAIAHLLLGEFTEGWAEHEWRFRSGAYRGAVPDYKAPRWRGESLRGRVIFLYGEQGFGDCIQFVRFVRRVAQLADRVYLSVPALLEPLMGTLADNCRLLPQRAQLPAFDFHCPLMSLPLVLATNLENIPADVPYLRVDEARTEVWRRRLGGESRPRVGIVWSGNPSHTNDLNRSIPLAVFSRLAAAGCRFVSLQPQVRPIDQPFLANWPNLLDAGPELGDFAETAALVSALDLVISVDTSVAHLAGALGKRLWLLLPHAPDWRWMLESEASPWYPTARLYRQPEFGNWNAVLARVVGDLAGFRAG
jgi:tetratricopeptide (TPR) repeat protein